MRTNSLPSPTPAFSVDFWRPYVPTVGLREPADGQDAPAPSRSSYSASHHGTHADFCRSEHFERYKNEVRQCLAFLADFCRRHHMPDAQDIARDLGLFFSHRFDEPHYFDTRAEIVDSTGKQSLDEFCSMIRNEAISADARKSAIRVLANGVTLCADGAVSNLVCAAATLAKAVGGIRGRLWEFKEQAAKNVLLLTVDAHFRHQDLYHQNEIHYVHTAWNALADTFGLEKNPDSIKMTEVTETAGFMRLCAARVGAALRPDRLARLIAETCQAQFSARMATAPGETRGNWDQFAQEKAAAALADIGNDIGLTSEDTLAFNADEQAWKLKESDLRLKSFLRLEEGERPHTYTYAVRTDPSLIALDVLRTMDGLNLLQEGSHPQNKGNWMENGMRTAILVYGELAVLARIPARETFDGPVWRNPHAEFEALAFPDILHWRAGRDNAQPSPFPAIVRQAIRNTKAGQLLEIPARWLPDADGAEQFLQRVGTEKGNRYLSLNLASIGAEFSYADREELLIRIMQLGMGEAVLALAQQWFPASPKSVDIVYSVLSREALPGLHRAMRHQEPAAAVHDWYQPLRKSGLLAFVAPRLAELLKTPYISASILSYAISNGYPAAIAAFYALLKDLLKDAAVRSHIAGDLADLLAATDVRGIPALSNAMEDGRIEAVQAYYVGLDDLLRDESIAAFVRLALSEALPDLLAGKKGGGCSGLAYVLEYGHSEIFKVFHSQLQKLLNDPDIAPLIEHALPDLMAARDERGTPGLSHALENGRAEVIDALHDLLKDLLSEPRIVLRFQHLLPDFLAAKGSGGTPGLSYARHNGHTAAMKAFYAILFDPAIRPLIQDALPSLMFVAVAQSPPPDRILAPRRTS